MSMCVVADVPKTDEMQMRSVLIGLLLLLDLLLLKTL